MAGYSGTPLVKKLGIKEGHSIHLIDPPSNYFDLLGDLAENVIVQKNPALEQLDFVHLFAEDMDSLNGNCPFAKSLIKKTGMLWMSWPKKASGVKTDLDGNVVREVGLQNGLVDIKVCAFDELWSALKFVYRKESR